MTSSELIVLRVVPHYATPTSGRASGATVLALPDTGAELDAIPESEYAQKFADVPLRPNVQPCTAVGRPIISLGVFQATIDWIFRNKVSRSIDTNIHVLRELKQPVLSKNSQQALHMLPPGYPHTCINLVTEAVTADRQKADLERLMGEFPNIFDGQCRPMSGPPCHFQLIDGVTPAAMRGSRLVSVPLLPRLKTELQNLEEAGIIRKVIKPTSWVHPIVVVPKKNGDIRLAFDFGKLNECIIRPNFETATPFQAVRTIPTGMKFFTVVDALKGYHQVPLDDESIDHTTFSTPFGRYKYLRLPFGIKQAGDDYCCRVSEVFDDVPNTRRVVEDILVYSSTYEDHVKAVRALFKQETTHGVAINTSKMVFAQPAVTFGGYVVDSDGFRPDPKLTRAISDFPTPHSITDIRSFLF